MLNKCAVYLTNQIEKNISISDDEKKVYVYGFEITLSTLISMLSIICISLLFNNIWYSALFLLFFYSIRLFCGGYHASSYIRCFILTNTIFISTIIFTIPVIKYNSKWLMFVLVFLSSIIIFICSPIQNNNHPYSPKRHLRFKTVSKIFTVTHSVTYIMLFFYIDSEQLVIQAAWSYIWVSLLILIELFKQKGGVKNAFFHNGSSINC